MINDIITSFKKSFDNNEAIFITEAPNTFRTPISLVRFSAIYAASANKPRQEIKMVSAANNAASFPVRCVSLNFLAYDSSANTYSNGYCGLYALNIFSVFARFAAVVLFGFSFI